MAYRMTLDQMNIFINAAQLGIACGLYHPFEWLINADRALDHGPCDEVGKRQGELYNAFLAFMKGTAGSPEENEYLQNEFGMEEMFEQVNAFCREGRARV